MAPGNGQRSPGRPSPRCVAVASAHLDLGCGLPAHGVAMPYSINVSQYSSDFQDRWRGQFRVRKQKHLARPENTSSKSLAFGMSRVPCVPRSICAHKVSQSPHRSIIHPYCRPMHDRPGPGPPACRRHVPKFKKVSSSPFLPQVGRALKRSEVVKIIL